MEEISSLHSHLSLSLSPRKEKARSNNDNFVQDDHTQQVPRPIQSATFLIDINSNPHPFRRYTWQGKCQPVCLSYRPTGGDAASTPPPKKKGKTVNFSLQYSGLKDTTSVHKSSNISSGIKMQDTEVSNEASL